MPRDHYVAQTYLKHFLDPSLENLLHVYDKKLVKHFTQTPKNVCYAENWDTNPYFEDQRVVEQFLQIFEPKWNYGVSDIKNLLQYEEVKYYMAGYIAALASSTPSSVRTFSNSLEEIISSSSNILMQQVPKKSEKFPDFESLSLHAFKKIVSSGGLTANVDPKYTHAIVINNLSNLQWLFYKSPWMILNNETDIPFLTSDFPVAYYYPKPRMQIPLRFVPISPRYAVLIEPSLDASDRIAPAKLLEKYPITKIDIKSVRLQLPKTLNKLTIQGAERIIVSAQDKDWILPIVGKYRNWAMDSGTVRLPLDNGELVISRHKPREQTK